jgi:sterol desaturase/sphingolipid hydroxylase (fatty acid hydroxylase superfamily)
MNEFFHLHSGQLWTWLGGHLVSAMIVVGASFLVLFAIFRPLEIAFPARPGQRFFRPAWITDLGFFLGQYFIWSGLVFWLLRHFGVWLQNALFSQGHFYMTFRTAVAAQPFWLQAIEVFVLSDLFVYWGHRLQHQTPILWRFHAVHHSAEHLDWLAAHREHPVDTVYTVGLINLPVFLLGLDTTALVMFIFFRGIWAIYIHSNVRLPIPWIRWLIGAPELHHWHHDRDKDAGNYANISPVMDLMFGTYVCPEHEPRAFGLMHDPMPQNYFAQLIYPFLPRKWSRRLDRFFVKMREPEGNRKTEPVA